MARYALVRLRSPEWHALIATRMWATIHLRPDGMALMCRQGFRP